jgi:uncharacterized protein (DUF488 family)
MTLLTIGHSSHNWQVFQNLLDRHGVGLLLDVRSRPRSRLEHFCKLPFRIRLNQAGISYIHAGDNLGGYSPAGTDYITVAKSPSFLRGIDRIFDLASRTRVVLACAEHEPLTCHRCLLIGRYLAGIGERVEHILRDGSVEAHADAEDRLLAALGRTETDLLASREARLDEAYRKQELRLQQGLRLPQPRSPRNRSVAGA